MKVYELIKALEKCDKRDDVWMAIKDEDSISGGHYTIVGKIEKDFTGVTLMEGGIDD